MQGLRGIFMDTVLFNKFKMKPTVSTNESKRVLLIDDDPLARSLLRLVFESEGYQCEEAENGVRGLEVLENQVVDLVITDNSMPILSGLEFLALLVGQTKKRTPPVIVVTGNLNQGVKDQAMGLGARAVLAKPYDLGELKSVVTGLFPTQQPGHA